MKVYPAIDVLGGNAVRLKQGRKEDVTVYGKPLEMARRWLAAGATWLHIVDLDGAFDGVPRNDEALREIRSEMPGMRIQLGGGIRSTAALAAVFELGVERAILGTSAVTDAAFVKEALSTWHDRIAVGIDARDGMARISGWTTDSKIAAVDLARSLEDAGARLVIYTDIARDGVLTGPNIPAFQEMLGKTHLRVIASGGVSGLADVQALVDLDHSRLDGVIIGKALYEGKLELKEALAAVDNPRRSGHGAQRRQG
jgi:phosphoribosylformimino-5-aminoimidazole carboxamide ribotide isomerase